MKIVTTACLVAAATAWSLAALATEPAPKPATEHCDDKGHDAHNAEPHGCDHGKPATGH